MIDNITLKRVLKEQSEYFFATKPEIKRQVNLADHFKSVGVISVVTGVRRCGKSTLLSQIAGMREIPVHYLSLDDPRLFNFSLADFERSYALWLETLSSPPSEALILYDEVELVNGWESWVNHLSDCRRY